MERSARHFGFSFVREAVQREILRAGEPLREGAWKVRLLLDADGSAQTGVERLAEDEPPLFAQLWPEPVHSEDSWLGHKTTHRRVYDEAQRIARAAGCVDTIFQNELGQVTEGAIHTIFVRHGNLWRTPPLEAGVLPGVYRRFLLEARPEIQEANITPEELFSADEVWLTNAVRGVRRVTLRK